MYAIEPKFGGELYNVLDSKFQIFRGICRKAGISPNGYRDAYDMMLQGKAKKFYYQHFESKGYLFDKMIARTRKYFHITENYQLYFGEWRILMLKDVISANSDKNLP
jgi:hypothetical protein